MNDEILTSIAAHSNLDCLKTARKIQDNLSELLKTSAIHEHFKEVINGLSTIHQLLTLKKSLQDDKDRVDMEEFTANLVRSVCEPLLHAVRPSSDSGPDVLVLLGCLGRVMADAAETCHATLVNILQLLEEHIIVYLNEKPSVSDLQNDGNLVDIYAVIDVLRQILKSTLPDEKFNAVVAILQSIYEKLVQCLDLVQIDMMGSVCIPALLQILKLLGDFAPQYIDQVWRWILRFSQTSEEDVRKQYMLLCGFANHFFPISETPACLDIRLDARFWSILQAGLYSKDSINRKRALYLLKRVVDICERTGADIASDGVVGGEGADGEVHPVFWWHPGCSAQLSHVWEDFQLMAEVMEEKQVRTSSLWQR